MDFPFRVQVKAMQYFLIPNVCILETYYRYQLSIGATRQSQLALIEPCKPRTIHLNDFPFMSPFILQCSLCSFYVVFSLFMSSFLILCRLCSFYVVFALFTSSLFFLCRLCSFYAVFALFMSSLLFLCRLCSFYVVLALYVVFALFMSSFLFYVVFASNFSRLCSF